MDKKTFIYQWLDQNHIPYQTREHPAVFTMEELSNLNLENPSAICKNLFLRDQKGKRHFLVMVDGEKRIDLKTLGEKTGHRLSFASEERLKKYLNLEKGSVTPLGIFFDEEKAVEVLCDSSLAEKPLIGVHPGENNATVFLSPRDLESLIKDHGNSFTWTDL